MPENPALVETIVTTDMAKAMAASYGVALIEVLTGFKYIGEQIKWLMRQNHSHNYVFGLEESYGCLAGTYARDKDALCGSHDVVRGGFLVQKTWKNIVGCHDGPV